jgi:small GTP-binding protein
MSTTMTISKKICLMGDFAVGKTSLVRRFVDRQFSDKYLSTVGVKISRKLIELTSNYSSDPLSLQLLIWDLEGSTRFKAIASSYLQGARGAIIVADVSRQETLDRVPEHIKNYQAINPTGLIIVALNKADLFDQEKLKRLVDLVQVVEQDNVLSICLTSAKTGENIEKIFEILAEKLLEHP